MKKNLVILALSTVLFSCGKSELGNLNADENKEINDKVTEKITTNLSEIDVTDYTDEQNLTDENLQKLSEEMNSAVENAVNEVNSEVEANIDEIKNQF